jgi:O-antigen/teichoic acid export membrane protein
VNRSVRDGPRLATAASLNPPIEHDQTGSEPPANAVPRDDVRSSLGSGAVYASTMAAQRAITFLLLPVFTRVLSPAQYGRLSIALSANAVAIVVFAFGMEMAIFRAVVHLADDVDARNRFVRSVWTFLLIAPLVGAVVVTAIASPFLATSPVLSAGELGLAMLAAALYVSATTLPLALLRADRRLRDFVLVNSVATATTIGLTLTLVVVVHAGVAGWLIGTSAGAAATLLATMAIVPYRRPRPFDRPIVRDTLRRSLPVMPHFLAMWSLQLADRVLLAVLVTTGAVGIYSLASNAATSLLVLMIGINQAFMPTYARASKPGANTNLRSMIGSQVAIVSILSLACALLAPVAINVFLDARYRASAGLTPWIVLGYGFIGLYTIPMNGVTLTHGRSRRIWVVSVAAAAVNLGLIYTFVPVIGLEAAAIASAVGYGVLLVGVWLYSVLTGTTIPYPWRRIGAIVLVTALTYAGAVLTVGATELLDFVLRLVWIIAATGSMALVVDKRSFTRLADKIASRRLNRKAITAPH